MSVNNYNILSPEKTVEALRDSGYRNTAYAIAELIDNSIDANATEVEVIVDECPTESKGGRTVNRVHRIAVLDNGSGMDKDSLRRALKFGDGAGRRNGRIGRFGMGLPNSSLSQCRRVDVWSWTSGPANAQHTYLDLDQISSGDGIVPEPKANPVPDEWLEVTGSETSTGTLVVWSQLDRVQWFRADSTFNSTENIIGRVYRRKISDGSVAIRLIATLAGQTQQERYLRVNDPLYLVPDSTTPFPFDTKPMFQPKILEDTEDGSASYPVKAIDGTVHDVIVRASFARLEARRSDIPGYPWPEGVSPSAPPGSLPWGKHAATNIGISVLREGRELDLDSGWAIQHDVTERWWGVEIEFPSALDEVFGVTNNKQSATIFHDLANWTMSSEQQDGENEREMKERLKADGDPRGRLVDLIIYLNGSNGLLHKLRNEIKPQGEGTRGGGSGRKRHKEDLDREATGLVNKRRNEGHKGQTDIKGENSTEEEQKAEQIDSLTNRHNIPLVDATEAVEDALAKKLRTRYVSGPLDTAAFFSIEMLSGMLQVTFNTAHSAYKRLADLLEPPLTADDCDDPVELRRRLQATSNTLKLLLFAWARQEDETSNVSERRALRKMRESWGDMAEDLFLPEG